LSGNLTLMLLITVFQSAPAVADKELSALIQEASLALESGRAAEAAALYEDVIDLYLYETDGNATGPIISKVRLDLTRALVEMRQYDDALRITEDIFDSDPGPQTLAKSLQIRFNIGFSYLTGSTRRLFGLEVSAERRGLEVLNELIKDYPFMDFTDDAIFHCGNWYLKNDSPEDAERYFTRLIREYPESEWSAASQLLAGDASMAQLKGVDYDLGILVSAERHYRRYLRLFPGQGDSARAREKLSDIRLFKARRRIAIADFYIRIKKFGSARIYLEKVIQEAAETPEAQEAREVLDSIRGKKEEEGTQ